MTLPMSDARPSPRPADAARALADDLAGETRRLRRLARRLLFDRGQADDVVQEAWLAALRRAPDANAGGRGWLAGAVRRLARNRNRAELRLRHRERAAARGENVPPAEPALDRLEVVRSLVDAVAALDEPYRETVLLRFFDDLAPREIARRQRVPVETVRTRLKRGLERLRARLDARHGSAREEFLAALAPLAGKAPWLALGGSAGAGPVGASVGGLAVSKTMSVCAASVVFVALVLIGWKAWFPRGDEAVRTELAVLERPSLDAPSAATSRSAGALAEPVEPGTNRLPADTSGDWIVEDARYWDGIDAALARR